MKPFQFLAPVFSDAMLRTARWDWLSKHLGHMSLRCHGMYESAPGEWRPLKEFVDPDNPCAEQEMV